LRRAVGRSQPEPAIWALVVVVVEDGDAITSRPLEVVSDAVRQLVYNDGDA
jgi:hypothetical protein